MNPSQVIVILWLTQLKELLTLPIQLPIRSCHRELDLEWSSKCFGIAIHPRSCRSVYYTLESNEPHQIPCGVNEHGSHYIENELRADYRRIDIEYSCDGASGRQQIQKTCHRPSVLPDRISYDVANYRQGFVIFIVKYPTFPWQRTGQICVGKESLIDWSEELNCTWRVSRGVKHFCAVYLPVGDVYNFTTYQIGPGLSGRTAITSLANFSSFKGVYAPGSVNYQLTEDAISEGQFRIKFTVRLTQLTRSSQVQIDVTSALPSYPDEHIFNSTNLYPDMWTYKSPEYLINPIPGVPYDVRARTYVKLTQKYSRHKPGRRFTIAPVTPTDISAHTEEYFQRFKVLITWIVKNNTYCNKARLKITNEEMEIIDSAVVDCTTNRQNVVERIIPETILLPVSLFTVHITSEVNQKISNTATADFTTVTPKVYELKVNHDRIHTGHKLLVRWETLVRMTSDLVTICYINSNSHQPCQTINETDVDEGQDSYKWSSVSKHQPPLMPGKYSLQVTHYTGNASFESKAVYFSIEVHNCLLDARTFARIQSAYGDKIVDLIISEGVEYTMTCEEGQKVVGINGSKPVWLCEHGEWIHRAECIDGQETSYVLLVLILSLLMIVVAIAITIKVIQASKLKKQMKVKQVHPSTRSKLNTIRSSATARTGRTRTTYN